MKIDLSKLPEGTKWLSISTDGDVDAYSEIPVGASIGRVGVYYFKEDNDSWLSRLGNVHD